MRIFLIQLLFFILPVFVTTSYSQYPEQERDLELTRRESAVSDRLQSQLDQILSNYYGKESYLVNIKAYLERIPIQDQSQKPINIADEDLELPGLPIHPSEISGSKEMEKFVFDKWTFSDKFRIKYIDTTILLDEKLFTPKDLEFVRTVTETRVGLDDARGDILSVKSIPFPPPVNALELYRNKEKEAAAQTEEQPKNVLKELYPYLYFGGAILAFLLFLIILLQVINIIKSRKQPQELYPYGYQLPPSKNPQGYNQIPASMYPSAQAQASKPMQETAETRFSSTENEKDMFYELRQLMVTTLIGNPKIASDVFKKWAEVEQDNGIFQITGFLKATDPKLIDLLSEYLGSDITSKVKFAMNQMTSVDKESVIETLKRFREEFQKEQSIRSLKASEHDDMFEFLKKMSSEQIYHVIKDEPVGIMAIALAQVPPEKANAVFKELPIEHQAKIPVEIGKLKKIPVSSYKDIADKLSKKAMEVERIKYISTDGVDALGSFLEQSSTEKEQEILASIALHDIQLADELRKVYITFDEISRLSDKNLAEILRSFDRELITKALIDSSEDLKEKILNNLPQRMRIMVGDEVKTYEETGEIPIDEVQKARRTITQKIREMAKSGLIDLKKILDSGNHPIM